MKNSIDKIAIATTVVNFELYNKTVKFFPKNIDLYVIDGRKGMHGIESLKFLFRKLKNKGIDWLIMADEDVIFRNTQSVFDIINHMRIYNFGVAGVRDGGVISHRTYNPYVINTFFSILNFNKLVELIDWKIIRENFQTFTNEFFDDLDELSYPYDKESLKEPYYAFYLYLRRCGVKFLFLKAGLVKNDTIANTVLDLENNIICLHTWYARCYKDGSHHTNRINRLIYNHIPAEIEVDENFNRERVILKDRLFFLKRSTRKMINRVKFKLFK